MRPICLIICLKTFQCLVISIEFECPSVSFLLKSKVKICQINRNVSEILNILAQIIDSPERYNDGNNSAQASQAED